jgi:hypothetical protein
MNVVLPAILIDAIHFDGENWETAARAFHAPPK